MRQDNKTKRTKFSAYDIKVKIPISEIFEAAIEAYRKNVLTDITCIQQTTLLGIEPIKQIHEDVIKQLTPYSQFFKIKSSFHNPNHDVDEFGELVINLEIDPDKQDAFLKHIEDLEKAAKAVGMRLTDSNF